jgi:putative ABC transport system permease protein
MNGNNKEQGKWLSAEHRASLKVVSSLAVADLIHDRILSLCIVFAVAAILSPILLVFGLKYGTIETLRNRLINDPRNREIRPLVSRSFNHEWINRIKRREDVAFIIPVTRQISATIDIRKKTSLEINQGPRIDVDIVPTAEGDRLIIENGAQIPNSDSCVITAAAAEKLEVKTGDIIIAGVKRVEGGRYISGELELQVTAILDPEANPLKAMYVRLDVLEAVEQFKDGMAVPQYGWQGFLPEAYPIYDGLIVLISGELTRARQITLINNTGFMDIKPVYPEELFEKTGYRIYDKRTIYYLSVQKKPVGQDSIENIRHRLRGTDAALFPWVEALSAEIIDAGNKTVGEVRLSPLELISGTIDDNNITPQPPVWNCPLRTTCRKASFPMNMLPMNTGIQLRLKNVNGTMTFPVDCVSSASSGERCLISARLAGVLNLSRHRGVVYDPAVDRFTISRRGYAGFRLYALSIDDVDPLRKFLEESGIPVHTEAARIRDVTNLDKYLTLIFWLIASVGLIGGIASLSASLYASVERKRRELGILRLMGVSGFSLLAFPLFQGICIACGGFFLALAFFHATAHVINQLFQEYINLYETLCALSLLHATIVLFSTIAIAVAASLFAAWRTARIEPAEALRDE